MSSCKSCGIAIPAGQAFCSMCYGDIAYGRDGYYENFMQEREQEYEQEQEADSD